MQVRGHRVAGLLLKENFGGLWVVEIVEEPVRGTLLAKRPDSSLGEVHRGSCSEDIHMEEENVEVKVQEEEVEDRERQ